MLLTKIVNLILPAVLLIWPSSTYTEGFTAQAVDLNPLNTDSNQPSRTIQALIYRGLTKYDDQGHIVGDLADSWEVENDGLVYTVHLKKGLRWDDGEEFDANDVLFTSYNYPPMQELVMDLLDPYTIRFTLPNPYSPFLDLLTFKILPAHLNLEKISQGKVTGLGPYRLLYLKKKGDLAEKIILGARNPEAKIRKIVFMFYNDQVSLETAAKLGEIDGFVSTKPFDWPSFRKVEYTVKSRYYALFFNNASEALSRSGIRKKLAQAVPTKEIILQVLEGRSDIVSGPLAYTWAEQDPLEINISDEESEDLELPAVVTLTFPHSPEHLQTATMIADAWRQLGVTVELDQKKSEEIARTTLPERQFQILIYGQEVGRDPDRYSLWHSSQKQAPGLNFSGFTSARADKALEEGRKYLSRQERQEHYLIFQHAFEDQLPAAFLYHPHQIFNVKQTLARVSLKDIYYSYEHLSGIGEWQWEN